MANVTDVFASPVHGTDPQNLIEYITRQRIYDGTFWKQECFGLNAVDVAERASTQIHCVGGCYGGNRQPTRFLALLLKLLQIQPSDEIVEELIQNEDFGYVRAMGAFYLRLTGRPADIYEQLEPLLLDYRRLRVRTLTGWDLLPMDAFVEQLLKRDRMFDIALPRLPKRSQLEQNGYLDGQPRTSPMHVHFPSSSTTNNKDKVRAIQQLLQTMANDGNEHAQTALQTLSWDNQQDDNQHHHHHKTHYTNNDDRTTTRDEYSHSRRTRTNDDDESNSRNHHVRYRKNDHHHEDEYHDYRTTRDDKRGYSSQDHEPSSRNNDPRPKKDPDANKKKKKKKHKEKSYGSLFKKQTQQPEPTSNQTLKDTQEETNHNNNSEEYWNEQRAKLGLKPLRK